MVRARAAINISLTLTTFGFTVLTLFIFLIACSCRGNNDSDGRRWSFLVSYNRRDNDPVYEHYLPGYSPLEKVWSLSENFQFIKIGYEHTVCFVLGINTLQGLLPPCPSSHSQHWVWTLPLLVHFIINIGCEYFLLRCTSFTFIPYLCEGFLSQYIFSTWSLPGVGIPP